MMKKYFCLLMAIAALGILIAGCDLFESIGGGSTGYEPLIIKAKTVDGEDVEIEITRGTAPRAVLTPENGDNYVLRMRGVEISRGTIALSTDRMFFYPSNGGASFTATYSGDGSANFEDALVILYELPTEGGGVAPIAPPGGISVDVTGVTLSETAISLYMVGGSPKTLIATVTPTNATNKAVTWISSNPAVATVAGGVVTAVTPGGATITATAGGSNATCAVIVNTWNVTFQASIKDEEWDGIDRAEKQEIEEKSMVFTQATIEAKAKAIRNAANTTPDDTSVIAVNGTITLTRYATVYGKVFDTDFNAIVITKIGSEAARSTVIDPPTSTGSNMIATYPSGTRFKYAVTYASKNGNTWVMESGTRTDRSGALIEFTFYKDGKLTRVTTGGSFYYTYTGGVVAAKAYDRLPIISISP
ncbi:MAG: Ig-like domain-containing protein [Treponema sp.]|jgi:hypothetical protein|nr:Ig-like domain-containing protein [Treponema sp.]